MLTIVKMLCEAQLEIDTSPNPGHYTPGANNFALEGLCFKIWWKYQDPR